MKLFAVVALCLLGVGVFLLFGWNDQFLDPSLQTKITISPEKFELTRDFADGDQIQIQIRDDQAFQIQDLFSW